MKPYLDLVRTILDTGSWSDNRTGIRTISIPGAMMRYDLAEGFPAVTTKNLPYKAVDQIRDCVDTIMKNPGSRRILFHGWNPAELDAIALPACHLLYQLIPNAATREISLCLYIRSNDIGLGAPFNLAEGAALLHLIGRLTGYRPRWFSYFIGDAHIYENHLDMLKEQLEREPYPLPKLVIADRVPEYAKTGLYEPEWLEQI